MSNDKSTCFYVREEYKVKLKINLMVVILLLFANNYQVHANLLEQIVSDTKYIDIKLSPDGNKFAMTFKDNKKVKLSIFDISSEPMKAISGVALEGDLSVGDFHWANNSRIIYSVLISRAWYNEFKTTGEMFGINTDGSKHDILFGLRAASMNKTGVSGAATRIKQVESEIASFEVIDILSNDDDNVLIKSTPFDVLNAIPTIYKLNINSGDKRKIINLPLAYAGAMTNSKGELSYAYGINNKGKNILYKLVGKKWEKALEYYGDEGGEMPISIINKSMFVIDDTRNDRDALYKINLENNEKKLVYQNDTVDISFVQLNPKTKQPFLIVTNPDKKHYDYLQESDYLAKTHKQLVKAFKGNEVSIVSFNKDLSKLVFKVSSDRIVGDFYLFDRIKNKASFLVSQKPNLKIAQLAPMQPISYKNRKGQIIHGYFTKALGVVGEKTAPMVVMPHGGPHGVRDYWGFDEQVQALATNGISVLQVNYTGSSGYGKKFRYDGYKHWGDLIQNDITDGTNWAIKTGLVNKNNVCIYGFSFGGYSALMSAVKEPDLYQCAAAGGGVYDLALMYKAKDFKELLWGKEYLKSAIGDNDSVLDDFSPINHTKKIKIPLLIAHGKEDTRVPIIQAKKLVKQLKKSGVKFEKLYYAKEAHGFTSLENKIDFNSRLISFLKRYLH